MRLSLAPIHVGPGPQLATGPKLDVERRVGEDVTLELERKREAREAVQRARADAERARAQTEARQGLWAAEVQLRTQELAASWTWRVVRGPVALLFGVALLVGSGLTLPALVVAFGAYAMIDGALTLTHALARDATGWETVLAGAAGVVVGLVALVSPFMSALACVGLVVAWTATVGACALVRAWRMRRVAETYARGVGVRGLLAVAIALLLALTPIPSLAVLSAILGIFALTVGVIDVGLAVRLYRLQRDLCWRATIAREAR